MWIGFFASPELLVAGEAMDSTLARNVVASPLHIGMARLTSLVNSHRLISGLRSLIVATQFVRLKRWNVRLGSCATRTSGLSGDQCPLCAAGSTGRRNTCIKSL